MSEVKSLIFKEGDIIKLDFEDQFQQAEYNEFDLDDVFFTARCLEFDTTPTTEFTLVGKAVIDEEEYTDFVIKFSTVTAPDEYTLEGILSLDWEWYDFVF